MADWPATSARVGSVAWTARTLFESILCIIRITLGLAFAHCLIFALARGYIVTLGLRPKPRIDGNHCVMRWFRTNRKFGGRLALFALAVQFVLFFGHIHPEDIYGPIGAASSTVSTAGSLAAKAQSITSDQRVQLTDDYCAICATAVSLSNSFVATAPQLPPLFARRTVLQGDSVAAVLIPPRHASFQSRAPPTA
jgi:hypothetical protein